VEFGQALPCRTWWTGTAGSPASAPPRVRIRPPLHTNALDGPCGNVTAPIATAILRCRVQHLARAARRLAAAGRL